jgi:hypothetical protein
MSAPTDAMFTNRGFYTRLDRYVQEEFGGNLTLAANQMSCSYDQLWNLLNGRTVEPSLNFLQCLIYYSGRSAEWWLKEETT